ncbi:cytoplasmic dynein 2 intermediate chain 1 isoform X1 [Dermacentor albipictus]|uniref:cytoplasmic dynein 2 intermediate chain 1 isoform X1 n=1 Tax=Dermacentor albipictus TaxID=60249 RepID=UPI0031FE2F10
MCAEQALASWGDLQPLRSKMSQKTRSSAPRPNGTQAKVPESRRRSTVDDAAGTKARSVSRDNRAPDRREGVKPPAQNGSQRGSGQHESRKAPLPPEGKKPPGQRVARSTSRQPDSGKSTLQPDAKPAPSRRDSKAIAADPRVSSRPTASKNKDSLASRVSNTGVKSPSRVGTETAEPSGRRHSRDSEKERGLGKVAATSSSGALEKRPKDRTRTAAGRPPGGSAEAKDGDETESKGSSPATSRKKQSSHVSKVEKPDHQERKSPYVTGGTSHKTSKSRPQKIAVSEKENAQPPTPTTTASKKPRTVTRQETYSAEQLQQAGSREAARAVEVAMETEQGIDNARASTSHSAEKVIPESSKSETSRTRHSSVADDGYCYDDDFEDYESDFENDDAVDDESSASSAVSDSSSDVSDSAPANGSDEVTSSEGPLLPTNDKLTTQEYSEVNSEKLKQQSHWKSEPVLDVDAKPPAPLMPTSFSTYSLVSYLTAQKKEEDKKVLSKAQQRAKDVLEMVSLDTMTYQVFDIPPVTYDVYISTFGRADAKQVLIQTELGDEEECQTENIELEEKWTQQPPHDYKGFGGGNGTPIGSDAQGLRSGEDVMNLLDFLKNSSDLMLRVIDEDLACKTRRNLKRASEVDGFSGGFLRLDPLTFAKGSPINFVRFSRPCPNYLVTGHDFTSTPDEMRAPGATVLCVWNLNSPSTPTDVLVSNCQVTCCHWSPLDAVSLVTGSLDGSVELWDLRDKFCLSKNVVIDEGCPQCQEYNMKMPAYSTASLFDKDCHFAKIVDVCCHQTCGSSDVVKQQRASQSTSEGGYNVWSLDEEGTLVSWAVAAVKSEPEGSLSDLGLAPGAALRLVRAAVFRVPHFLPPSYEEAREGLRTFGVARLGDTRLLVTTDIGVVVHLDLYKARTSPKVFSPKKKPWAAQECCISLSPHHPSFFLVASRDGALRLHSLEYEQAVWEWDPLERTELGALIWSPCAPTQFYVTTAAGEVTTWDLSMKHDGPTGVARFPSSRVLAMDADSALTSRTLERCLALAMDDGVTQVHLMGPADDSHRLSRDQIREKLLGL